jgi:hypothetical protein
VNIRIEVRSGSRGCEGSLKVSEKEVHVLIIIRPVIMTANYHNRGGKQIA